jgi:hypothetical protein
MYAEYVKNFDQAMNSLSKWKQKSPKFAGVIENIQVLYTTFYNTNLQLAELRLTQLNMITLNQLFNTERVISFHIIE